ncbi:FlgO family outer membrane protein [Methylomarinum sp. Ch1-1]|uniref:FlgO family outer membrane protein n=1 Tax=Methylomarinum roseum TaxID=3067653 RepID=A0AAU7NZY6_9GAMM|nr:FlgO family outer membrane protein [Methylomarinum sp. Ch1-1]MDP4521346.1 FlgO family outer membrane protein [Methylomarinum sp. Ch1-1]
MWNKQIIIILALSLLGLSGCNRYYRYDEPEDANLVDVSYSAVDQLLLNLKQPLPENSLVVINSLVNVDDLSQEFSFGRILSEQLSSAFHRSGYRIVGMELPTEIFEKNENGILHLAEETKQGLDEVGASALVVGVFAPGKRNAYVSLKVFDIASQNIISSTDLSVPMGPDAKVLLKPKKDEDKEAGNPLGEPEPM